MFLDPKGMEGDVAHHGAEGGIRERERERHVANLEVDRQTGSLCLRPLNGNRRVIHRGHPESLARQDETVAAGAASQVEHGRRLVRVQEWDKRGCPPPRSVQVAAPCCEISEIAVPDACCCVSILPTHVSA